jgi:hypothetical protein
MSVVEAERQRFEAADRCQEEAKETLDKLWEMTVHLAESMKGMEDRWS